MTPDDARRILNVDPNDSPDQIRAAYRDLVKVWHPDRFAGDERLREKAVRRLQEINDAYALLEDDTGPRERASSARQHEPQGTATQPAGASATPLALHSTTRLIVTGIAMGLGAVALLTIVFWPQLRPRPPRVNDDEARAIADQYAPAGSAAAAQSPRESEGGRKASRPESGTEFVAPERQGGGSLVIYNQSRHDGVVALATAAGNERVVYVRAGEQTTLVNVAAGRYRVRMALGLDWVNDRFTRDVAFQELEAPVDFVERSDDGGTEFTRLTVSLQPLVAGMQGVHATTPFSLAR